jgi:hypothetical protein
MAASAFLMSCATVPPPATAADAPNVLVVSDDADKDTVPCSSRVFERALNAITNQVREAKFKVFDETWSTMDAFVQGRCRRTDAEVIDIARSIQTPPIDVAVIFKIYANAEQLAYTTKIAVRLMGRMLDVGSGERLGNFEVKSPNRLSGPHNCPRECILEVVGDETRILAQDLGDVLAVKLRALTAKREGGVAATGAGETDAGLATAFVLTFDGFDPKELTEIEEYLVSFKGYEHHRTTRCSRTRCEYWYESSSDRSRLNRNLRRMLEYLGVEGRISTPDKNAYLVELITRAN